MIELKYMKYDTQLVEIKNLLPSAKSVLIALPVNSDIDKLAAGLALYLSLEQSFGGAQNKQVTIVCEDTIKVGQAHLFAIDRVRQNLPPTSAGNLVLTLEGVELMQEGGKLTPKALEKLDWYGEGNNNLNLVFHVLPGQSFQPTKIVPKYQGGNYDLIFTLGATNLNDLGSIYQQNPQVFSGSHLINVDHQQGNTSFGQTNVLDFTAAAISEIMVNVMNDLGLSMDGDIATNLLAGIFDATANLTNEKAGPDTFQTVAVCLRAGGKKPQANTEAPITGGFNLSAFQPQNNSAPVPPQPAPPVIDNTFPAIPVSTPSIATSTANTPSPEERPSGEGIGSEFEPDWLTPKVFKGTSIG